MLLLLPFTNLFLKIIIFSFNFFSIFSISILFLFSICFSNCFFIFSVICFASIYSFSEILFLFFNSSSSFSFFSNCSWVTSSLSLFLSNLILSAASLLLFKFLCSFFIVLISSFNWNITLCNSSTFFLCSSSRLNTSFLNCSWVICCSRWFRNISSSSERRAPNIPLKNPI